jgi:hypothetical protein
MSITVSLIVVVFFIILAITIQYLVRTNIINDPTTLSNVAMITSDLKSIQELEDFSKDVEKEQRLFFYMGENINTINFKYLLKYFYPINIFFITNKISTNILVENDIYKPSGPDDIFWKCGYYKKHLQNSTIDIICFNYSCQNCDCENKQINQLKSDLDNLQPGRKVYILLYFPKYSYNNSLFDKISVKYKNVISGIFTSDKNIPLTSLNQWESEYGLANTWNIPNNNIKVKFPINTPLVLSETDLNI